MNTPISDVIKENISHISFHTPGNDGTGMGLLSDRYDLTEVSFTDNIIYRTGVIAESEMEVAKVFGSDNVLFCTSGSTTLINIGIRTLADEEPFLVYENAHGSVFNSLRMLGAKTYVSRGVDLIEAIKETGAKRVVITSPNYFGKTVDLELFKRVKEETGAKILWDCAHGSHFSFSDKFPKWDPKCADVIIHSLHKTTPAMTSGAIMHVSDEYVERAKTWFMMIHTTSPSFPILMSIEYAVKYLVENGTEQFNKAILAVEKFKVIVKNTFFNVYTIDDPTRVTIESELEGSVVADYLELNDIYPEMTYGNRVVLIVTPFNYDKLENVAKCLLEIDTGKTHGFKIELPAKKASKYNRHRGSGTKAGKEFVGIKELVFSKDFMKVELEDAVGHIAYKEVGIYPPGVPDIYSGDIITAEDVEYLKERIDSLFGLLDGKMRVVAEED